MSADSGQKSFDATPARKQKAKRDGNVARSAEVTGIAAFACGSATAFFVVPLIGAAAANAIASLAAHPDAASAPGALVTLLALSLAPAGAAAIGAVAAGVLQAGGVRLSAPKWQLSRLAPAPGFKRMFGGEALTGMVRAVVAFAVAALVVWPITVELFGRATTVADPGAFGALALDGMQRACWAAIAAGALFAVADYALVRRRWLRSIKMTLEEVRRDQKDSDGDPAARSRRKAMHRTLIAGSIARTKDASFVVVNPTHIAIALRYAPPDVAVPQILVRAADAGALQVKLIARRNGIPIVENVALARLLFAEGEAGRAIPNPTFVAVARVIAELIRVGALT